MNIRSRNEDEKTLSAVDHAVAIDLATGTSKLWSDEREWAIQFAREHGVEVFENFLAKRKAITSADREHRARLDRIRDDLCALPIDAAQSAVNAQIGVSEESLKNHGAPKRASSSASAIQQSINRQLGISDEVFKKYSQ